MVAGGEDRTAMLGTWHDLTVAFDRHPTISETEQTDQCGDRRTLCDGAALTVDDDVDVLGHRRRS